MFFLICFDISDDKTRTRAVKILKKYSIRVQKSVFEAANINDYKFQKLRAELSAEIDHRNDSIRYYPLCKSCRELIKFDGTGSQPVYMPWVVI